jgi:hypothetical protein
LAKRQARENGIVFTIIKNGKIYKVFPNGQKVEDTSTKIIAHHAFEPIRIAN